MEESFVRDRITQLRLQKGISEYQLSYDLGHSKSYINNISTGKALPSMAEFLYICEYFGITPVEFFDPDNHSPTLLREIGEDLQKLDREDLELVSQTVKRLLKK